MQAWGRNDDGQLGDGRALLKPVPFMVMPQIDYVSEINDCKGYETCYDSIQEAIDEARVKALELKIQQGQYGTVSFNGCYYFRLFGGFDDYYSGIVSASSVKGPMVIDNETVEFVNVEIRCPIAGREEIDMIRRISYL